MPKTSEIWYQPYRQQVGDQVRIGFDLTKCYSVKTDDLKNFQTDTQLTMLAATIAHQLLGYALTLETDRPPIVDRNPIKEQVDNDE